MPKVGLTIASTRTVKSDARSSFCFLPPVTRNVVTLSGILNKHLPKGQLIDFMSIDVEGLDYDVLQSNDWSRFRPEIILVEIPDNSLEDLLSHEITKFLHLQGYVITSKSMYTVFFALEASR